jgi:hypothetical protein
MWVTDARGTDIIEGTRDKTTGLYMINTDHLHKATDHLPRQLQHMGAAVTPLRSTTVAQRVAFFAASMGGPVLDTLLQAMRKGYVHCPGLTATQVAQHPPDFTATPKGHLRQRRQGIQPTNYTPSEVATVHSDVKDDFFPDALPTAGPGKPINTQAAAPVITQCVPLTREHFSDMAGKFPYKSFRGAQYMLIMYSTDANYIHCETMPSRQGRDYAQAYERGINFFQEHGITPQWERLDNETSKELEWVARKLHIKIQYLPPNNHRASKAERAIQTWKGHFISTLCLTHPDFPMGAWDEVVPQAELTLNLMRGSRVNPALSAWAQLHGPIDLLQTPIAPVGTKVIIFESPEQRTSWAPHGVDGFYLSSAMSHYRCYNVFVTKTKHMRVAETLSWHPHIVTMPGPTRDDMLLAAIQDLTVAVDAHLDTPTHPSTELQPFSVIREQMSENLRKLNSIFSEPHSSHW